MEATPQLEYDQRNWELRESSDDIDEELKKKGIQQANAKYGNRFCEEAKDRFWGPPTGVAKMPELWQFARKPFFLDLWFSEKKILVWG